ncbi:MAG TPA: cellulase family glycosylhydrolase [Acidimicrobiales bacterium]|nr:cellulase family glycosylhydrolase [Acidimicrobiales bacterium]
MRVADASGLPLLSHHGRWLTDPQGRVVILHGLQIDHWETGAPVNVIDLSPQNVSFMATMGFNLARVSMTYSGVAPVPGSFDQLYVDDFVAFDHELASNGIYDLLDMMQGEYSQAVGGWGFPNWMTMTNGVPNTETPFPNGYEENPAEYTAWDNFWANTADSDKVGLQQDYAAGLHAIAGQFADAPALLGIEILNEPWPGASWPTCANPAGCPAFDQALTSFYRRAVPAIRSADPNHLVVYEPNIFFDFGSATRLGNIGDPNALFAFHNYCLSTASPVTISDPLQLCGVDEHVVLTQANLRATTSGDGLLMDEWGNTTDTTVLNRMAAESDADMMGWSYWAYEDCCGSAAAVLQHGTEPPAAPGNLNASVLDALVRPYPQAIAGTPTDWSFNPTSKVFHLDFTTKRIAGGSFPIGVVTKVEVPALQYPGGYSVSVTGARVMSAPDAPALLLATDRGATAVRVTITAKS